MFRTLLGATILSAVAAAATAGTYTVTVTNNLDTELLAPILITECLIQISTHNYNGLRFCALEF
jgi:hypothetical protein